MFVMSIFDRKVGSYGRPIFCRALGEGMRIFRDEVNRPAEDNILFKHPEDFDLYHVGSFDEESGKLLPIVPVMLDTGVSSAKEVGRV